MRLQFLSFVAIVLCSLGLYVVTMPQTITLEDAGLFQMACHLGGIAHPPGYPLFTLICQSFVTGDGVLSGNLISALFGALACGMFFLVVRRLTGNLIVATVAALAWALSTTFWSQAIVIEVYTLAAFLFMMCWWLLATFASSSDRRYLYAACLVFGLALANHWPLMLLSSPALAATLWPARAQLRQLATSGSAIITGFALVGVGLLPYLTLLQTNPPIALYGEIDSVTDLVRYVMRSAYADEHAGATALDKLRFAVWVTQQSFMQWGWVGAPLVAIGLIAVVRFVPTYLRISFLLLWLGSTLALVALLDFDFTPLGRAVFKPYPILAVASVSILFALGIRLIVSAFRPWLGIAAVLLPAATIVAVLVVNLPRADRSDTRLVEAYARTVLSLMPPGAVLFVSGDNFSGPFGYLHYVERVRPDIELRDWENLVFDNRLMSPYAPVSRQLAQNEAFILAETRPVFATRPVFTPRIDYGAFYGFDASGGGYGFPTALAAYLDFLLAVYQGELLMDGHERHFAFHALIRFSRQYIGFAIEQGAGGIPQEIGERVAALQQTFPGRLVTLELLLPQLGGAVSKNQLLEVAATTEQQIPDSASAESVALFYELVGRVHEAAPTNRKRAIEYYRLSIDRAPVPDNGSICRLSVLYRAADDSDELDALSEKFQLKNCKG